MLREWWARKSIIHYELLPPRKTISSDLYCQQLIRLKQGGKQKKTRKIVEKRFAQMKKLISPSDSRIKAKDRAEPQKLGRKYRVALRIIKDPRFERIACLHKGTYADDCIVQRVTQHKCYIVATNDKDLKRRIRKIPGVPIMYVSQHRYTIERMPDAYGAPKGAI
ncbi:rRNA-processing protein FCF1 homolog [Eumeta japonica]|uniref:rRNA-processing protein FCF1 homolog n=1 Tax=Eumeta variegata TaxID=151549 RepID=A0A4C1U244_EUMVA|nr:rRNA-processing protein FCF1 homolog [Eumeta japonica]